MKANELMLNDLIFQKGYPEFSLHISSISETAITCKESFGTSGIIYNCPSVIDLDDICLIPLTAEILELNGFVKYECKQAYCLLGEGIEIKEQSLRNALRLCGLNELADNFKIE